MGYIQIGFAVLWILIYIILTLFWIPSKTKKELLRIIGMSNPIGDELDAISKEYDTSKINDTVKGYYRARTKKNMYIALVIIIAADTICKIITNLVSQDNSRNLDIIVIYTALIAIVEAIESHNVAKEKYDEYHSLFKKISDFAIKEHEKRSEALVNERTDHYNSLSTFGKMMYKFPERPVNRKADVRVGGRKYEDVDAVITKTKVDGKEGFLLDFPKRIKGIDREYFEEADKIYQISESDVFAIQYVKNNKKIEITIYWTNRKSFNRE